MTNQYINNPEAAKEYTPRYRPIYALLAVTFLTFTMRLWYLQIIKGTELREFSEKNRIKEIKLMAPRGLVFDREGRILVENLAAYDAVILPQYVEDLERTSKALSDALGLESDKILQKVHKRRKQMGPFAIVKVKENLSLDEVFRVQMLRIDYPGIEVRENIIRSYPLGPNGAQLFGYVAEISKKQLPILNQQFKDKFTFQQGDLIGKSGVEELRDIELRGQDGYSFIQVDAHGRELAPTDNKILGQQVKDIEATPGHNIQLTIDRDLQEVAYKSFTDLERTGAIVAMKSNGEVLAWVSTPSFDPNEFSKGISPEIFSKMINDPFKPFRNKVIQDHTAPGSTFKPLMAIAALEEKMITPTTIVNCPGSLRFGSRPYHDHLKGGFGNISVFEAIERSSNVFFYKQGIALGIDRMHKYISLFGLGSRTNIELKRENGGLMPSADWKKKTLGEEWQPGENLSTAIGQGFVTATPLQMAVAYNAMGTEGKVVKPFLIKKLIDPRGQVIEEHHPEVVRDLQQLQPNGAKISLETFKTVKEAMRRVVQGDRGTAKFWRVPHVEMAGKTGTSQVRSFSADDIYTECTSRPIRLRHHGWFVAFAPADNPEIAVAILAEHACHGSTGAAPVVRDIVQAYMKKNHPELFINDKDNKTTTIAPPPAPPAGAEGDGE
jgi:penicillin-binding protein 2